MNSILKSITALAATNKNLIPAMAMAMALTTTAVAGGYEEIDSIIPIGPPNEVVNIHGENGNDMHPDDFLFNKTVCPDEGLHDPFLENPVLAPDGHHITWGEYSQVQGRARLRCGPKGTHVVIHLSGLIPKGVYTIWLFTFAEGVTGPIGAGSLGASDGSQNGFVASASGEGTIVVHHPAGDLSVNGSVGSCLFDEYSFHLVGAYHLDGEVYGPAPSPIPPPQGGRCYWVPHFAFVAEP